MAELILDIQGLDSWYGRGRGRRQVLRQVCLTVAPGQAVELQVGDGFSLGSDRERFVITRKGGV